MGDLSGRRAIVCGSTQGIGRASAEIMARHGASVTLIARNEMALESVVASLPAGPDQRHERIVADFEDCETVAELVRDHLGQTGPTHILVNNTGGPPGGPL